MTGEDGTEWRPVNPLTIARLRGLRNLYLSGVYQITDISLKKFEFLELRELSLAHCQMVRQFSRSVSIRSRFINL